MANIKSQKKRIRTNEKARQRNAAIRSELKTAIRSVPAADSARRQGGRGRRAVHAGKKLDKAVSKGVIHKNQAANRKSAISKKVAAL